MSMKLHFNKQATPTLSNAQTAIVDISLDAVALCNEGCNSRADIIFTKRKENKSMTYDEILSALQPGEADVIKQHVTSVEATKDAEIATLTKSVTDLQSEKATLEGKVTSLEKSAPTSEEDIMKGLPEGARKMFEEQQTIIRGLVAAQAEELAKSRFEKVKAIPCEEASLKDVLKSASPAVLAVLEAAAAAIEKGMAPKGADSQAEFTADSGYSALEKHAKELQKADSTLTFESAFTKACELHPDAYKKYVEGVK